MAGRTGPGGDLDPLIEETVERIHSTAFKFVLFVTGGASQAPSWLLAVPGASRTVLEVRVPYAKGSLAEVLGHEPSSYSSAEAALEMSKAAYRHAANLSPLGTDIIGVGCTCALATDRTLKGQHRAYVSTYSGDKQRQYRLVLAKETRGRFQEDTVASRLLLRAVADASGVATTHFSLGESPEDELTVETQELDHASILKELLNGRVSCVEFSGGNIYVDAPRRNRIYLPGSFNPLHDGHTELLQAACRQHPEREGCFELSIGNADKGLLPLEEIQRRVAQFIQAGLPLVVTQAPLFTMKADLFKDSLFVVGYDTAVRLVRADYYGDETAMLLQFAKLKHQGCGFLVAGRTEGGRFKTLADMSIPGPLQRGGLFEDIPENLFRSDISSTELRAKGLGLSSV